MSWVWLVPLVAGIAGLVLVVRGILAAGPVIEIQFKTASGIKPGETEIRARDVVVGKVRDVQLSDETNGVVVTADIRKSASYLTASDSRFWVVRPRVDTAGISGLSTLLSGAYIALDGGSEKRSSKKFVGLESPPPVTKNQPGTLYTLYTDTLGSLDVGSPVYYRRLPAGRVVDFELDEQGRSVTLQVFINPPFDSYVNSNTRFWNASGIDFHVSGGEISLKTQSLATLLAGGLAFGNDDDSPEGKPSSAGDQYRLYASAERAMESARAGQPVRITMHFDESIAGLSIGAGVNFNGVNIGDVTKVNVQYEPNSETFTGQAQADLYPQKLGAAYHDMLKTLSRDNQSPIEVTKLLVKQGMDAQLQTASILTGEQQVSLQLSDAARQAATTLDIAQLSDGRLEIPTSPGALETLQFQLMSVVEAINKLPFEAIAENLNTTLSKAQTTMNTLDEQIGSVGNSGTVALSSVSSLLQEVETQLTPQLNATLVELRKTSSSLSTAIDNNLGREDSSLITNLQMAVTEMERSLRSMRALADSVKRDPQSLLLGNDEPPENFGSPTTKRRRSESQLGGPRR